MQVLMPFILERIKVFVYFLQNLYLLPIKCHGSIKFHSNMGEGESGKFSGSGHISFE